MRSVEQSFEEIDEAAKRLLRSAATFRSASASVAKAASSGSAAEVERALEQVVVASGNLQDSVDRARGAWPSGELLERYLSAEYLDELLGRIREDGGAASRHLDEIRAFPFSLTVSPAEHALRIDGKKSPLLRPSSVLAALDRQRKPRYPRERFLESLFSAYLLALGESAEWRPVGLRRLYEVLTLLPTGQADYPEAQFVRDVAEIDHFGPIVTKAGASLRLLGSTGIKNRKECYTVSGPDGQLAEYFGLQFTNAVPAVAERQ